MAAKYYLLYSVQVDGNSGAPSSSLQLYTDSYGTPEATGTVLGVWSGAGPNLAAALVDGVYKANKTSWTETMSGGGGPLDVEVSGAGTAAAAIRLTYGGRELAFDASALELAQSAAYPARFTYNQNGVLAGELADGYSSSLTSAAAAGADGMRLTGVLDPAADRYVLRWRAAAEPDSAAGTMNLAGTTAEVFPIEIYGLEPETAYSFELVSIGARGESVSAAVSGTTGSPVPLAAPQLQVLDTDSAGVKQAVLADVAGAAYFDLEIAPGGDFTGPAETVRVTNSGGARVFLRDWPESASGTYGVRARSVSGSAVYADSAWGEAVSVEAGAGQPDLSDPEMTVYSNIAIRAVPSGPDHAATVSKVSEMISGAVGTVVNSVGGCSGTVTMAQLAARAADENILVCHSSGSAPNVNNLSVITASSTDAQVPSARAVYHCVQNLRGTLTSLISGHYHSYLCTPDGGAVLAAPALGEDGTIVPDTALAGAFDSAATYPDGAVVSSEGYLYRNTSGGTSAGNRDFQRKWTKVTAAELIAEAAQSGGDAGGRYETAFYGADLDQNMSIVIGHNLGRRYVFVELIDLSGAEPVAISARTAFLTENTLKLTFSEALPAAGEVKVLVRV